MKADKIYTKAAEYFVKHNLKKDNYFIGCCDAIHSGALPYNDLKAGEAIGLLYDVFGKGKSRLDFIWAGGDLFNRSGGKDKDFEARLLALLLLAEMFKGEELTEELKP